VIDFGIEQGNVDWSRRGSCYYAAADSGAVRSTAGGGDAELARGYRWLERAQAVHPPALPQLHDHTVTASAQLKAATRAKVVCLQFSGFRPVSQPVYQA
jgi:hypothetical protein